MRSTRARCRRHASLQANGINGDPRDWIDYGNRVMAAEIDGIPPEHTGIDPPNVTMAINEDGTYRVDILWGVMPLNTRAKSIQRTLPSSGLSNGASVATSLCAGRVVMWPHISAFPGRISPGSSSRWGRDRLTTIPEVRPLELSKVTTSTLIPMWMATRSCRNVSIVDPSQLWQRLHDHQGEFAWAI
jgi:hypothetical protein